MSDRALTVLPRAVLFDWDNTLIDSWATIHDALNTTFGAMGQPLWSFDETRARVRKSLRETFPEMFGDRWEEAMEVFYDRFRAIHLETLAPRPGSESLIVALAEKGVYLGVVSNKSGEHLRREAAHLGWDRYFGQVVGAMDAARDKPAVEPVEMALQGSGIAAGREVWFVGDTWIDMHCAHNAGCVAVLISETAPAGREFADHAPDSHFQGCAALAALVRLL